MSIAVPPELEVLLSARVLVIAAHTDDEALGCGATIRWHADRGDRVAALRLTDGVGARDASGEAQAAHSAAAAAGRGADVGLERAEAFVLVRRIER